MIGKVIAINEGKVKIRLTVELDKQTELINNHIIFESKNNILVGEILTVEDGGIDSAKMFVFDNYDDITPLTDVVNATVATE